MDDKINKYITIAFLIFIKTALNLKVDSQIHIKQSQNCLNTGLLICTFFKNVKEMPCLTKMKQIGILVKVKRCVPKLLFFFIRVKG